MTLTPEEKKRYARHLVLSDIGVEGQEKLKKSRVLVIGAGGLGSPALLYLGAAGVGTLGIVDGDVVEESNLQRQVIHSTAGEKKVESAKKRLLELNPHIQVEVYPEKLTEKNAQKIVEQYDIVVDGSDNFPTRYLVNDACVLLGKPLVYGSVSEFSGQASVFNYKGGPCYRCMCPQPPKPGEIQNCSEGGVLGVIPGIIGMIQATETIKVLLNVGETLSGRLLTFEGRRMQFLEFKIQKNNNCALCGKIPTITHIQKTDYTCSGGRKMENIELSVQELQNMMEKKEEFVLVDVREKNEWEQAHIEQAMLVPLSGIKDGELGDLEEIPKDALIVLHCKMGGRSMQALEILKEKGYTNLKNLEGGITTWAQEIEPELSIE